MPREGNGNPLWYSCLENFMDGGARWATVHGSQRVGHDCVTSLSLSRVCASCSITDSRDMNFEQTLGDSGGQRRLVGYSPGVAQS